MLINTESNGEKTWWSNDSPKLLMNDLFVILRALKTTHFY